MKISNRCSIISISLLLNMMGWKLSLLVGNGRAGAGLCLIQYIQYSGLITYSDYAEGTNAWESHADIISSLGIPLRDFVISYMDCKDWKELSPMQTAGRRSLSVCSLLKHPYTKCLPLFSFIRFQFHNRLTGALVPTPSRLQGLNLLSVDSSQPLLYREGSANCISTDISRTVALSLYPLS